MRLHDEHVAQSRTDLLCEVRVRRGSVGELDAPPEAAAPA